MVIPGGTPTGGPTSLYLSNITPATNDVVWCQVMGTTVNVQVTDTSATAIPTPLILVIESISDPTVTVANADGIVTPAGPPFFDLTGQLLDGCRRHPAFRTWWCCGRPSAGRRVMPLTST